ncbi:MAG: hypothetical protein KDB02_10825 [Acidimicrobiales bacterium]|nr:hypothetical protein [Acidimicrobiales bacterium]
MNLLLFSIAVAWIGVGVHALVRRHRNERPNNSVVSFREQLANLERAAPGSMMRVGLDPMDSGAVTIAPPVKSAVQRRREVFTGLLGSTVFTFLLFLVFGGALTGFMFFVSAAALGAYSYALRQLHLRKLERSMKVRAIPLPAAQHGHHLALPQSAVN